MAARGEMYAGSRLQAKVISKTKEILMARLIVEAEATGGTGASSGVAKPGDQLPLYIVVSVTHGNGTPQTGLGSTNFRVEPIIVAPGGGSVTIAQVGEPQPGAYLVQVVPITTATWQLGRYIFWAAVSHGTDHGQTVCSVLVD